MKNFKIAVVLGLGASTVAQFAYAKPLEFGSDYTSLAENRCKMIKTNENEEGYYLQTCPAVTGYKLEAEGMDLRNWLNVKVGNHAVSYRNMSFSSFGDKAEWRYHKDKSQKNYHALIYRMYEARRNEKTGDFLPQSQDKQSLVVIRLNKEKSCVLGVIPLSKSMNQQARNLADNFKAKCQSK